jgi:hypothetical protein
MSAMLPPADRLRPTTPRACLLPFRRPRRWGRLLVLGLILALVATLGAPALADDTDDGLAFPEFPGEPDQANQPPASHAADQLTVAQGDPNGDDTASVTPPAPNQPLTVAQAQAEHTDGQVQAAGQQTGQTKQDEQPDSPAGGCLDGLCSQKPPDPGDPTVNAAAEGGGWLGPLWRALSRLRGQQPPQPPQEAQAPVPPQEAQAPAPQGDRPRQAQGGSGVLSIDEIEWNVDLVRRVQEERQQAGHSMYEMESRQEFARLARARYSIEQLEAQAREGALDVDVDRLANLRRRFDEAHQQALLDMSSGLWEREIYMDLESAEEHFDELRARSENRPTNWSWSGPPDPQRLADRAHDRIERARSEVEAGRFGDPRDSDRLRELEHWHRTLQQRLNDWKENQGSAMNAATVAPPLTSEHAQGQRPVVLPPLAGSGGPDPPPTTAIPPTLAADLRALGIPDLSDSHEPGVVVKPVPPSQPTPAQEVLTTERSPLQQAALDGLRNAAITGAGLSFLSLLYQLGYLAVGGVMYLPGSRPPWAPAPATPVQG